MSVFKRGDSPFWWYKFSVDGKPYTGSSGTPDKKAAEKRETLKRAEVIQQKTTGTLPKILYVDLVKKYSDTTFTDPFLHKAYQYTLAPGLATFKGRYANDLTFDDWDGFRQTQLKRVSVSSVNRYLTYAKAAYEYGVKHKLVQVNPLRYVKIDYVAEAKRRVLRFFDAVELAAMDKEMVRKIKAGHKGPGGALLRDVVKLALATGMREGELANLEVSKVNLALRYIDITKCKGADPRVIKLNHDAYDVLLRRVPISQSGFVFEYNGEQLKGWNIYNWFRCLLKFLKIKKATFHILRHTFAAVYLQNGGTMRGLQQLLGHADPSTTQRYAFLSHEFTGSAIMDMPSLDSYANATQQKSGLVKPSKVAE